MVKASIVILTMDEEPTKVLNCLKKQTFKDFEVILASEKGIVKAMNNALHKAQGEIFVRVDDDVEIPKTWLAELLKPFSDPSIAGTTGPTFVPKERRANRDSIRIWENPNRFLRWLADGMKFNPAGIYKSGMVSYDSNYEERFVGVDGFSEPDHLEGTNWAMKTQLIRNVGGFDEAFDGVAEWYDTDVEQKVKKLPFIIEGGYRFAYNPKAYLYHLVEIGAHFDERFEWIGRIENFVRYHRRHSKFHPKMIVYLLVWIGYFLQKEFQKCRK